VIGETPEWSLWALVGLFGVPRSASAGPVSVAARCNENNGEQRGDRR